MPAVGRHKLTGEMAVVIDALVIARHRLGLSNEDVDARLGTTRGLVNKWENGIYSPTLFNLVCWAEVLGVSIAVTSAPATRQPSFVQSAYRRWLVITGRRNTKGARRRFYELIGVK